MERQRCGLQIPGRDPPVVIILCQIVAPVLLCFALFFLKWMLPDILTPFFPNDTKGKKKNYSFSFFSFFSFSFLLLLFPEKWRRHSTPLPIMAKWKR